MSYIKINYDDLVYPALELINPESDSISDFLSMCHTHIDCDMIESTYTAWSDIFMIVDESGKLKDGWHRRINGVGTAIHGNIHDVIVGNCILAAVQHEDFVPLNESQLTRISRIFKIKGFESEYLH